MNKTQKTILILGLLIFLLSIGLCPVHTSHNSQYDTFCPVWMTGQYTSIHWETLLLWWVADIITTSTLVFLSRKN